MNIKTSTYRPACNAPEFRHNDTMLTNRGKCRNAETLVYLYPDKCSLPVLYRQNKLPRNYLFAIEVQSLYPCWGQTQQRWDKNNHRVVSHIYSSHKIFFSSLPPSFCSTDLCYVGALRTPDCKFEWNNSWLIQIQFLVGILKLESIIWVKQDPSSLKFKLGGGRVNQEP